MSAFEITREIGIDAAHRVTYHHSKCRSLHGHRYTIQATCTGELETTGSSEGMVLDFGFLKEAMLDEIDKPCDHGTILWFDDPLVTHFSPYSATRIMNGATEASCPFGKIYLVTFVPTAENLAKHWFKRLAPIVLQRSKDRATLKRLRVYETPNCWADYEA